MEIKELSNLIAESMVESLEVLNDRQAAHRERWFSEDENGVKNEVYETYVVGKNTWQLPRIGLEVPEKLVVSKVKTSVKTDVNLTGHRKKGLRKLVAAMFAGRDETSEIDISVEFKQGKVSEGLMALHQRAVREIKDICTIEDTEEKDGE